MRLQLRTVAVAAAVGAPKPPNPEPTHLWCLCHLLEEVLGVQQAGVHLGRCLVAEAHHKYLCRSVTGSLQAWDMEAWQREPVTGYG